MSGRAQVRAASARQVTACHYCGLPAVGNGSEPAYCCYGCRFAEHITGAQGEEGLNRALLARLGFAIFFSMNVIAFSMALWIQDHADIQGEPLAESLWGILRYLCLFFTLPVVYLLGIPLWQSALGSLREWHLTMDLLLVVGVLASLIYSMWSTLAETGHVYFEVTCAILVLVTLGKWLEAEGKRRTTEELASLARLLPEQVTRVESGQERQIPADELQVGDVVRVLAGAVIPADGRILVGSCAIDQQVLTGESAAVVKGPTEKVLGGTHCLDGDLLIEVTTTYRGGSLQRLIDMVHDASRRKGRYERLADSVSAWFVPTVLAISLITLFYHTLHADLGLGIRSALGVLVIACPCALGLATPMATWAAMGTAARHQVIFQASDALEKLASVRALRLDKTGTITTGEAQVIGAYIKDGLGSSLPVAASLSRRSLHPMSHAVAEHLKAQPDITLVSTQSFAGLGIEGKDLKGTTARLGSRRFLKSGGFSWNDPALLRSYDELARAGDSLVCFGYDGEVVAVFVCSESLRPETKPAIAKLKKENYDLAVLTGDHRSRGEQIEQLLGIPVLAELLPADKVRAIQMARGDFGSVAMIGDGINDAPALAESDVGIAMGAGADLSRATADVCLLRNDLLRLPWILELSKRTVRIIKQNLLWAFSYNTFAIGIAVTGRLHPVIAAVAMLLSSFLVVGNSLRLTRQEPNAVSRTTKWHSNAEPVAATGPVTPRIGGHA